MNYYTSLQMAEKWGVTKRRVNALCQEGLIKGAVKSGIRWMIPEEAEFPKARRNEKVGNNFRLPLPIGVSDYQTAVSEYYYVDKTLLIRDLLDYHPLVSLFTRPRRFGKTLNMDMLRTYFEKTDENTSQFFEKTKIWKAGEKYRKEQGKYPVIFLTFKDIKYQNWEDTEINFHAVIQSEYKRHLYLLESSHISDMDKEYMRQVISGDLKNALWPGTLGNLALLLDLHHGIAPMIMIDEYDTPIQQGYMLGFYEDVVSFMRNFLSGGLKDNRHLSMAFLTGILRVAKESIFSGLNNVNVNSVLEERYSEYFGFTESEVRELLACYNKADCFEEVKNWYDGYQFGQTGIFNPWSVLNYVDTGCKAMTFWQSTGSNDMIGDIMADAPKRLMLQLRALLNEESVDAYIDTSVVYPEIHNNPESVFSFLLMSGYLTIKSGEKLFDGNSFCKVCIPNREIAYVYEKEILNRMKKEIPTDTNIAIQHALFHNNTDELQTQLENFLFSVISFHDVSAEGFYHGLLLGMTAMMNQYYWISSNRESGDGRYDILLKPKDLKLPAFIMELKSIGIVRDEVSRDDLLAKKAIEALYQIDDKKYETELKYYGVTEIRKLGIAFSGKYCRIRSEQRELQMRENIL